MLPDATAPAAAATKPVEEPAAAAPPADATAPAAPEAEVAAETPSPNDGECSLTMQLTQRREAPGARLARAAGEDARKGRRLGPSETRRGGRVRHHRGASHHAPVRFLSHAQLGRMAEGGSA